ncbi:chloramphenicol phosphotransferase CPT family protein [Legionella impletisoli]|uniref:O-phosphotransferase n=1 Tax=Legionella impletisoli TaxID=343510 RepID=A0A917JSI7_9GAMM|nr:AAA family ATPase [Legionella impletisoli]GGI81722.1 putative O-phosphotransferase [Legionella impletisoli]
MTKGQLVILNGGSSAGKTSTCAAFQDLAEKPYVRLGIDRFWSSIPPKQMQLDSVSPDYYTAKTYYQDNKPYFHVSPGPVLDQVMYASYDAIAAYLDLGINVISDQIFWKPEWLIRALDAFKPFKVYMIALYVSDEEGARRERARSVVGAKDTSAGGRPDGWNRCSALVTHKDMIYDLEVDNTTISIMETASRIKHFIDKTNDPTAFQTLYQRYNH